MIDPILFYLINVVDGIKTICAIMLFLSFCVFSISAVCPRLTECTEKEKAAIKRVNKFSLVVFLVLLATVIIIPSKETLMEMLVAKYATAENGKAILEYIVETVREIGG